MSNYYDLSSILELQRNAIIDLSNIYSGSNISINPILQQLQGNLNSLATSYQLANSDVGATLTEQNKIKDIVDNEKTRLNAKKNDIEGKLEHTRRMLSLNDSATKRKRDYMKILLTFAILLVIYIIIIKLTQYSIIPSFLSEFLIIVLIGVGIIYMFILWRGINVRNNMDHDKLNIPPPNTLSPEELAKLREKNAAAGSLTGAVANPNTCVGQVCCATGSTWEPGVNKCIKTPASGNVTLVGTSITITGDKTYNDGQDISRNSCVAPYKICGIACIDGNTSCISEGFTPNVPSEFEYYTIYTK